MPLGLVSYGSSDSEDSDNEQEDEKQDTPVSKTPNHKLEAVPITKSGEISDEDDDVIPSVLGDEEITADIPGLSSSSSLLDSLPSVSKSSVPSTSKTFVDENEDLTTIPKAKIYSEKPDLKALKPKKKGPVRIMAPRLASSIDDDDDDDESKRPMVKAASTIKSGLFGLLPPPKNSMYKPISAPAPTPATSTSKPISKSMMVPRSVSKKPPAEIRKPGKMNQNDSDDEEEVPFFTMGAAKMEEKSLVTNKNNLRMSVKANPEAFHPHGLKRGSHPSHQFRHDGDDFDSYSAVTAPYPPPPPEPRSEDDGYIQPSQEALQRLAGTASKRSKLEEESFNQIIDVKFDDIKPDEREWLTKALTEDEADKPGPKNTIKGERKSKHQITWLAAEAKQNEQKLKKQWADSASNKRAAGNKYGF